MQRLLNRFTIRRLLGMLEQGVEAIEIQWPTGSHHGRLQNMFQFHTGPSGSGFGHGQRPYQQGPQGFILKDFDYAFLAHFQNGQ